MRPVAAIVCAGLLAGTLAHAEISSNPPAGCLLGDELRFGRAILPVRAAADLLAIPAGIPGWELYDWALFSAVALPTVGLMLPLHHPLDARIQRWVRSQLGPSKLVWTPLGDVLIWTGVWSAFASGVAYGWLAEDGRFFEHASLMFEAFAVAQVYQLLFKLALGREGPNDGEALGVIHGPAGFFRLFPAGTPSGHVASLYAFIGVVDTYWNEPWLTTLLHLFGVAFATFVVVDNYHFVSDVVWGAGMGYFIGRWVAQHRSSSTSREASPVSIAPGPGGLQIHVEF
ncbi:MAG: phosphatase PAP2 family protein [Myxococcota bacterium]